MRIVHRTGYGKVLRPLSYALALLGWTLLPGCAGKGRQVPPAPTTKPVMLNKPVIDFSRGGGGLPLEGVTELRSIQDLIDGLTRACQSRVELPANASPVTVTGQSYRNLDLLRIDVSNGAVHEEYKPGQMKKPGKIVPALFARRFEYVADPLHYQNGTTHFRIEATNARMGLLRESAGQPLLVLTEADDGLLQLAVKRSELNPMMVAAAKTHSHGIFWVKDASVELTSENSRTVAVDLHVSSMWLLVPAKFHIHGRLTVEDDANVTLTEMFCKGEDVGGDLVAGFVNGRLRKYDGKTMPMAKWPGDKIAIRDVQIHLDDELRITIAFGAARPPSLAMHPAPAAQSSAER